MMGILLFSVAVIVEISFMAYCMKTEDNQSKARNQARMVAFVVFLGGLFFSIIDWSFRWYFFGGVLTILATNGGIRLYFKKFGGIPYRRWRIVSKGLAMLVVFTFAAIPAIAFPQYKNPKTTGKYNVITASYTYTDMSRIETFADTGENRKLNVEFWYPQETEGKYPLIVFSHGAFGVKMSNSSTFQELASNGYVVCSIDHPYHAAGTMDSDGKLTIGSSDFMQEVIDVNGNVYSEIEQFAIFTKWMDLRTQDIDFVIDTILQSKKYSNAAVYDRIDANKIGLIGHSLGGAASVQLGRVRKDIGAVINLDGSMLGEYKINREGDIVMNEEPYPLPMLNFYSEYVINELKTDPEFVYANQYISSISSNAFEITIKGTNHLSYTDLPLFSPLLASQLAGISGGSAKASVDKYDCIETMNKLILEFYNSYVKGEGTFVAKEFY